MLSKCQTSHHKQLVPNQHQINQKKQQSFSKLLKSHKMYPEKQQEQKPTTITTYSNHKVENYRACMILAAVGDTMGYKNGDWEFLTNGSILHQKMMEMTDNKGPLALRINLEWRYSDDTVMHIATALALTGKELKTKGKNKISINQIGKLMGIQYKKCWQRMGGRAPGKTTGKSIKVLNPDGSNWDKIPFNDRACGCGASMRSACIGLAFYDNIERLVAVSIQSGRLTHHNPAAYLASLMSSYFTALAIKGVDPVIWLAYFLEQAMPLAQQYIKKANRQVKLNLQGQNWKRFIKSVEEYAKKRSLSVSTKTPSAPSFPQVYDITQRQHFYHQISWGKWPGALGIDSVLIAYDAFLSSAGSWEELCLRGVLHGGDNDSTGTIAGAWFGAYYGFKSVPAGHYEELEDNVKLKFLGEALFNLQ